MKNSNVKKVFLVISFLIVVGILTFFTFYQKHTNTNSSITIYPEKVEETSSFDSQVTNTPYDVGKLEQMYVSEPSKYQEKAASVQEDIANIYHLYKYNADTYIGGEMIWPTPDNNTIASPYGWRFDGIDYHSGIDVIGTESYGKDIVAANSGIVQHVAKEWVHGEGMGQFVIIDHGGSISTLYAQCSSILVNTGDFVKKGQKIAEIGSSGLSTGPHLHFEVRSSGMHVNPLDYFSKILPETSNNK